MKRTSSFVLTGFFGSMGITGGGGRSTGGSCGFASENREDGLYSLPFFSSVSCSSATTKNLQYFTKQYIFRIFHVSHNLYRLDAKVLGGVYIQVCKTASHLQALDNRCPFTQAFCLSG